MNWNAALVEVLPALRRYALFLTGNMHEAEDLVNDCVVRVLTSKATFDQSRAIRPWAFQILRNLFLDLRKKSSAQAHFPIDEIVSLADDTASGKQIEAVQVKQTLSAIMSVPEASSEVLILVAVEGFSYKEAAECLKTPIGTVMSRLARARMQLADVLGETNSRSS